VVRQRLILAAGAIASGLILSGAFEPVASPWLAWLFPLPITLAFRFCRPSVRESALAGYALGLAFWATSIFWVTEVTWLGWVALVLYLSLFKAVWGIVWAQLMNRLSGAMTSWINISTAFLGASAWTGLEWVRGTLFTGFPWNYLGVSQARLTGLIQVAEFGGVLLLSWVMSFVGLALALTLIRLVRELRQEQRIKAHFEFTLSMLLVAGCFLYGLHTIRTERSDLEEREVFTYLAVQPDLPQDPWGEGVDSAEAISLMDILSRSGVALSAKGSRPDLIVWPETPVGQEIFRHPAFRETQEWLDTADLPLLMGSNVYHPQGAYNSAVLLQPGQSPQFYFKNHLVIMGEYVPFADSLPVLRKLVPTGVDFKPGSSVAILNLFRKNLKIGPLICFEDVVGPQVRRIARQHPDLFINITNDGWFNDSAQSRQHLAIALFRTVEFRRPMLRVTNNGVTAQIDEFGIIERVLIDRPSGKVQIQGTLSGQIRLPEPTTTFYARFGDWVGWGSLLISLVWIGLQFIRSGRQEPEEDE
jgi:apolipoprotein N-acyltransferase